MYTGRDAIHKHLMTHDAPVDLKGGVLYHCGPVAMRDPDTNAWSILAAGPTTSIREEPYQAEVIRKFGVRVVIGKGGMGPKTLAALNEYGGVYLNAIGGAAQFYARCVERVAGVDHLDFGIPEAMWHLDVHDFQAVVTMDAHGNSLHDQVAATSEEKLALMAAPVF
jgi:fumarate hydratase class I